MTTFPVKNSQFSADHIRKRVEDFLIDCLEIEPTRSGYALAVPQTFPDGWQMTVDFEVMTPTHIRLSDRGRTLSWLMERGQNVNTDNIRRELARICKDCGLNQDGIELFRIQPIDFEGVEVHVFAEALVNVAHLHYYFDAKPRVPDMVDKLLNRVFTDHGVEAKPKSLSGKKRKKVPVDYYIPSVQPCAFKVIRRKGKILDTMERWDFRWRDLREAHPNLRPAMVYNEYEQDVDEECRAIGEEACDLFCSYEDTDRIHEFLGKV